MFLATNDLEREQSHSGESDPRVETVEVGDGGGVAVHGPQVVRVEHGDEPDGDARDGEDVEHRVQQLVPNPAAATASAVHEHRCNKIDCVCPGLLKGIRIPIPKYGLAQLYLTRKLKYSTCCLTDFFPFSTY